MIVNISDVTFFVICYRVMYLRHFLLLMSCRIVSFVSLTFSRYSRLYSEDLLLGVASISSAVYTAVAVTANYRVGAVINGR